MIDRRNFLKSVSYAVMAVTAGAAVKVTVVETIPVYMWEPPGVTLDQVRELVALTASDYRIGGYAVLGDLPKISDFEPCQ